MIDAIAWVYFHFWLLFTQNTPIISPYTTITQVGRGGDGCWSQHEGRHTQRPGSLWGPRAPEVAVRRLVERRQPRQQHGGRGGAWVGEISFFLFCFDLQLLNYSRRVHITQATLDHLKQEYEVEPGMGHLRNQYLRFTVWKLNISIRNVYITTFQGEQHCNLLHSPDF